MSFLGVKSLLYIEVLICLGYGIFFLLLSKRWRASLGFGPLIIVAAVSATAFLAPNLLVLNLICVALIPLLAKRVEDAALYLAVALFTAPELPFEIFAGGLKLIPYTLATSLSLGALLALLMRGKGRLRGFSAADIPFLAMVPLLWFAAARDSSATHVLREGTSILVAFIIPYWVITRAIRSPEEFQKLLVWLIAATAMMGVVLVFERLTSWPLYTPLADRYDVNATTFIKSRYGELRAFGPLGEATRVGFLLVIGLAATFVSRTAFAVREFHWVMLAVVGLALWAPQSRGALLGAAIVIACIVLYRSRGGILMTASIAALGAGAVTAVAIGSTERDVGASSTLEYRELLWLRGSEEFWKHPLTGASRENVIFRLRDLYQGEGQVDIVNSYLYFALTAGAVGAAILIIALLLPAIWAWLVRASWKSHLIEHRIGAFVFAISLSAATMFFFTGFLGRPALLLLSLAGLGISLIVRNRAARGRASPSVLLYRLVTEPARPND